MPDRTTKEPKIDSKKVIIPRKTIQISKVFSPKNDYKGTYNVMLKDPKAFIEQKFSTYLTTQENGKYSENSRKSSRN